MSGMLIKMLAGLALFGGGGSVAAPAPAPSAVHAKITFARSYSPSARRAAIRSVDGHLLSASGRSVTVRMPSASATSLRSAMGVLSVTVR